MLKFINKLSIIMFLFTGSLCYLKADVPPEVRKQWEEEGFQRRVEGFYDMQYNTISNIQFTVTNTGSTFYDEKLSRGTGIWPRGSINCYVFGGGIWVGTEKKKYLEFYDTNGVMYHKLDTVLSKPYQKWDRDNIVVSPNGDTTLNVITVVDTFISYLLDDTTPNKIMGVTYNPQRATSFMVPGRIDDGDAPITTDPRSYRVYFSLDYSSTSGAPFEDESAPAWPIWDISTDSNDVLKYDRYFGFYVKDTTNRNTTMYPRGPAFISGEDIFATYKDTDLSKYSYFQGVAPLMRKGYPQRIQYEQMIYSWGFGDYRDFIFIKYDQINMSGDTLWKMWLAPLFDVDIALITNFSQGARNDITCFYGMEGLNRPTQPDPDKAAHNMAYQYSQGTAGEAGRGFGYCGFVFLESPSTIQPTIDINQFASPGENAVLAYPTDSMGFVRKGGTWLRTDPVTGNLDTCYMLPEGYWYYYNQYGQLMFERNPDNMRNVPWYPVKEQLGLVTFRNWPIAEDKRTDEEMYAFISEGDRDGSGEPGDMRYMMATGPFHMRPGDTSRTVVGLVIAATGKGGDADGTDEDLMELVRKVEFMQRVYDENFRAPAAPDYAVITSWEPLNNGMLIRWDSTSEMSTDPYEKGMNFLGYKIYRARRTNLDTFDMNIIRGNSLYPSGKGPYGWKEIASFSMQPPFVKSRGPNNGIGTEGTGPRAQTFLGVDSLMVIGPYYLKYQDPASPNYGRDSAIDLKSILCVKVPNDVQMYSPWMLAAARNAFLYDPSLKLGKLEAAGWYDTSDRRYTLRIAGIVNSIDQYGWPWGQYLSGKTTNHNFENSALMFKRTPTGYPERLYNSTGTFLFDSAMLVRLELNPALALINPLFYYPKRVPISKETIDSFYTYDTIIEDRATIYKLRKERAHWITRDSLDEESNPVVDPKTGVKILVLVKVDTLYNLGSERITSYTNNGVPNGWSIDVMLLRDSLDWLKDLDHYNMVMDSIYQYIKWGWVKQVHSADFSPPNSMYLTDFASSDEVKRKVIVPTMDSITNRRTFVDIGDDPEQGFPNGNAFITKNDDPATNEQLYNNVPYYYKVLAFDEGDWLQPTPTKTNVGLRGLPNLAETFPTSDRVSEKINFKVIETEGVLGGLYGFEVFAIDEERAAQLFAGDTLELEFIPMADGGVTEVAHEASNDTNLMTGRAPYGYYYLNLKLTNITKGVKLFEAATNLEPTPCNVQDITIWTDNAAFRTKSDSLIDEKVKDNDHYVDLQTPYGKQSYDVAAVRFTTGDFRENKFCYSLREENMMWGNIGFSFNAALKQYGGIYRGDSVDYMAVDTNVVTTKVTPLYFSGTNESSRDWCPRTDSLQKVYVENNPNRMPVLGGYYGVINRGRGFREIYLPELSFLADYEYSIFDNDDFYYTRFDNGPGEYIIEFLPGGEEELELKCRHSEFINGAKKFRVRYLNVKVTDTYSYKRLAPDVPGVDSVEVSYPPDIPFMELPIQPYSNLRIGNNIYNLNATPSPFNLAVPPNDPTQYYRKFNLYANAYYSKAGEPSCRRRPLPNVAAAEFNNRFITDETLEGDYGTDNVHYLGTQGRYYLSVETDQDTIDFVHTLNIAGANFVLSYLKRGYRSNGRNLNNQYWTFPTTDTLYGADFKAGDKIKLISWGGVSGFPEKGAKVRFAVSNPYVPYTDDLMDEIKIVPNPYVITHQNQASAYGGELYFTKLPAICTIEIFSAAGDLVTTLEHNETFDGNQRTFHVYDLLTKNGQRVQSQTLIALIKTPDGAMTTKHFSIIVGGFRVID
ncbi:MAG: hypothetical protein FWG85_06220 [Bacteroidetes bacterium]|nr:hypothetical protein [Bacteroidota bacterium]